MLSGETSKGSGMQQSAGRSTGSWGFWRNLSLHLILQGALEHGTSAGSDLPCSKVSGLLDLHLSHWILAIKLGWVDSQALCDKETPVAQTSSSSAEASGVWAASAAAVQHMQQLGVVGRTGLAREILPAASSHLQVLILQCLPGLWPRASHFPSPSPCCFLSLEHPSPRSLPGCSSFLCLLKYHLLQEVFPGLPS